LSFKIWAWKVPTKAIGKLSQLVGPLHLSTLAYCIIIISSSSRIGRKIRSYQIMLQYLQMQPPLLFSWYTRWHAKYGIVVNLQRNLQYGTHCIFLYLKLENDFPAF